MFYHSLLSDWNHGNAHFLRGVATELITRGHRVEVFEPVEAWSYACLVQAHGTGPIAEFEARYPGLRATRYDAATLDLDAALDRADLVIVHEWNKHDLVRRIGRHRSAGASYRLLFHDTHHRAVTDAESMAAYDLRHYDGVLAFGDMLRDIYLARNWIQHAWTWHEAADVRHFHPLPEQAREGDLVWIGNWGDGERAAELQAFLLDPVHRLGLRARVHGVRYPEDAVARLAAAGIDYAGWLPNFRAPEVFARFAMTVHIPRRPYATLLPGIPTIRVFEALACGIALVCAPWEDAERLFRPGSDYLVASSGAEMARHLNDLRNDAALAGALARSGRDTILSRHTCAHRVDELLGIVAALNRAAPETMLP